MGSSCTMRFPLMDMYVWLCGVGCVFRMFCLVVGDGGQGTFSASSSALPLDVLRALIRLPRFWLLDLISVMPPSWCGRGGAGRMGLGR